MTENTIILDIETIAYPREKLEAMMPAFGAVGNTKDPAKVAAQVEEQKAAWIEKAALSATTASVAIIGMLSASSTIIMRADDHEERTMLSQFWAHIHSTGALIVGHNLRSFDLPFLIRRSFIKGVIVPLGVLHKGRLDERFIDTMEVWAAGEWGAKISLNNLAKALGVGEKSGSGADFGTLWASDKSAAIEYCKHDLELTRKCAERMGL